ncbi:MAG: D-glycero-beta-D-manno-heptose-7-phosphate kinase [Alphaproteobacteria bacterium]|nr:D-glycero-beta-D-manno-heptose-7-phosphate kinase [Alphaproteobacteria bacterium]
MSNLASRLDQFIDRHILCVGDLMLDRYVYGQVERISPEAPIPVLRQQRETTTLGGAGNVVRNVATLGGRISVVGVVGQDKAGSEIAKEFRDISSVRAELIVDPERPTTEKTRYVAGSQQILRADHEVTYPLSPAVEKEVIERISSILDEVDAVILSDYNKGVLTPAVIETTISLAKKKNKPVIVDPKGRCFLKYKGATFLTPNRKEISDVVGSPIASVADAETAARELMKTCGVGAILVKLGADGACLVRENEKMLHLKAEAREVFDVSGAGDTVIATLSLALTSGFAPAEASKVANTAGSIVVGKVGTAFVTRDEIARALIHGEAHHTEDKVVGMASIADIAERWRKLGLKVGFTNGCFDLLHPGHIALLRQARATCDKLVVGLNSDASVKRLKGAARPIQNEAARSTVLASLADVDHIVIFDEDTPLDLIKAVRPDVLIKGADYTLDKVVGAAEVQSWHGRVVLAHLVDGQSTTNTIAKMKG